MNAIEKFAKEHGAEYEDEKTLAPLFKKAVQSVIGKKGKVRQAWTYTGSNEYGYVDWEASVVGVDGMMPEDEIVIVLTTDLDDGNSWVCGRYMDENDTIAEVDDTPTDDPFDAVFVIDKLMSEVREERSSKGESKKNERGSTQIETYDGFDELLGYADAEYLLEDVVDVLSQYYTYEDETFDEDQAKDDPEFTIKIEGGDERADFYSEDIFYVHLPNKEAAEELAKVLGGELSESKKPESCKDGKKESMEHCDSCGAVMTEYDYDRYGGLCKRCRDKGEAKKPTESSKKNEKTADIGDTMYASKLKSLVRKFATFGVKVSDKVEVLEENENDKSADYKLSASKDSDTYSISVSIYEGKHTTISVKDGSGKSVVSGEGKSFASALSTIEQSDFDGTNESRKKSEGIGDRIKMGIDYNMFMRMCRTAAYLDEDEDYWDALWEYYSEMGEISDALEFFDNLFQYTAWCDADELYDEYLDDKFKDKSKSKEECIEAAIDDGDLQAYKHEKGNYLVIL